MFALLKREIPCIGSVHFRGSPGVPPRAEEFTYLKAYGVQITRTDPGPSAHWSLQLRHDKWGEAEVVALRDMPPCPHVLIDWSPTLSDEEKRQAKAAGPGVSVRMASTRRNVLADRKRLLRYLSWLMGDDGVIATDHGSELFWSRGMLDDELSHDADLDVEALYCIHAVGPDTNGADKDDDGEGPRLTWVHTHGLANVGAFDFDILNPGPSLALSDPLRAIAFAILEGAVQPNTADYPLAYPGGNVRFVPAYEFQRSAPPEFAALRDHDENHSDRRAVLCEPVRGLLGRFRKKVRPSRFLSGDIPDEIVYHFSHAATELMAQRARNTFGVFRALLEELAEFQLPAIVKLGYPTAPAEAGGREHLWFEVHTVRGDTIDATLVNQPHAVPTMNQGDRGEHSAELLSDWVIITPIGHINPRQMRPAREIREDKGRFREFMRLVSTMHPGEG